MALADSRCERFRPRCGGGAKRGAAFANGQQNSVLGFQFIPRRRLLRDYRSSELASSLVVEIRR
jgi:hypothetical protein